jgi:hypothetical protein
MNFAQNIIKGVVIVIVGVAIVLALAQTNQPALSATSDNVSGYAWSSNIGWISFNCTNDASCASSNYGVNVDATGNLSGYAWSSNIGWVSFNASEVSGCPSGPCAPVMDRVTGDISGWARALSQGSGWDGWINLRGAWGGVTAGSGATCSWSGWAWGSTVVGWINFSGSGGSVQGTGDACSGAALSASCSGSPTVPNLNELVTWSSSVTGGTPPYTYNWSGAVSGPGSSITTSYSSSGVKNATITVDDSSGQRADPSCSVTVSAPPLAVGCSGSPGRTTTESPVTWSATVAGGEMPYSYSWTGDDGLSGSGPSVVTTYSITGTKNANVNVSDGGGQGGSASCAVTIDRPFLREVIP